MITRWIERGFLTYKRCYDSRDMSFVVVNDTRADNKKCKYRRAAVRKKKEECECGIFYSSDLEAA